MGPNQIHNILDYVIQPGGRFSPQLVGVMMRPGTGANSGFATARRINGARALDRWKLGRDFGQSARAT
jgi:hypothetical protein